MTATADTADTGRTPATGSLASGKVLLFALLAALGAWLALGLGLAAALGAMGDAGDWIATYLPWACLAVAAYGLYGLAYARGLPPGLSDNRLRVHVIGWSVLALAMLILWAIDQKTVTSALSWLGKTGGIIAEFTETNGLFFAAFCAIVAAALLTLGQGGPLVTRPVIFERFFVQNLTAKAAAIPMVIVAMGVFFGGTIWTIVYSFTNSRLLPKAQFVGLDQYERLWGENRWWVSIENLAIYGFFSMVFSLVIGFFLAVLLDQKIRFENTFRTIFLYPFALSFIVTGLVWQWVLNPDFGIQSLIRSMGWTSFDVDPLYDPDLVIYGILFAGLWQGTGLIMCLMLAGLRGIDEDVWKAARVDGIPAWKTYIFIIIPMMRPVFITTLVLIASGIVRVYDLVVAQTSGGPGIASEVPAKYVYDKAFLGQNLAQGFAASTMMLLSVLIVLIPWAYLEFSGRNKRV